MQCTLAEKLIPLFVSNDLPDDQMKSLGAHLDDCATCRQLAAEFSESQNWLRTFAVPTFDEAIFDDLRTGLARDLAEDEQRPRWFAPGWNPRFAFAAAMATILLVAAFGIYLIRHQPKLDDKLTLHPKKVDRNDDHPPKTDRHDQAMNPKRGVRSGKHKRPAVRQYDLAASPGSFTLSVLQYSPDSPEPKDVAVADTTKDREMLRIEMQTTDPNIRIIWLTHKDSNALNSNR